MKLQFKSIAAGLGLAFSLSACVTVAREVPFNESTFTATLRPGSEIIQGQAFTILKDRSRRMQENGPVYLMPKNAYTDEIVQKEYNQGSKLGAAAPHFQKYVRETRTDVNGNFVFRNLASGHYYVACNIKWHVDEDEIDGDGNAYTSSEPVNQWIWDDVTIRKGDSREITGWNQGQ